MLMIIGLSLIAEKAINKKNEETLQRKVGVW
jgi:hypothetical protein